MQLLQPSRCRQLALFPARTLHVPRICAHTVKGRERVLVHHSRKRASIQGQDFRLNDVVTGVVQNIASYGAFVDMDGAVGLLHISQITHERISSVDQVLKVGDEIKAMVHFLDEDQQKLGLSTKKLEYEPGEMLRDPQRVYEEAEATAAAYRERVERAQETKQFTKQNERDEVIDSLRQGEVVAGVVQGVEPYGAFVDIGSGTRALLHISDITGHLTPETLGELFKIGDEVKAMVIILDKERGRINLSTKVLEKEPGEMMEDRQRVYDEAEARAAAVKEAREQAQENKQPTKQNERDQVFDSLRQGDVVAGVVQNVQPYGVFVDIGTPALLHISAITAVRLTTETLGELFKVGDQVKAMIKRVDKDKGRISLSTKVLEREPGEMTEDRQRVYDEADARAAANREPSERVWELKQPMEQTHRDEGFQKMSRYEVVAGVVQEVKTYGAFVDIGGGTIALLHISQVSHSRIESMQRVFKVGDQVKAMVLSVDKERGRISLTTKKLEHEPGEMMEKRQQLFDEAEARAAAYVESLGEFA